jgi:hypothetical protein
VNYDPSFGFYHRDRGDIALNNGITKLAIVNPALPATEVDGQSVNCIQMARRDGGASERFGITNVAGETGTWLRYRNGVGFDHANLLAQSDPEFVVFALNDADEVQGVWIYPIGALPHTTAELIEKDIEWFATFRTPNSYEDRNIPGTNLVSWDLPGDDDIYASWTWFGWNDIDWNYSDINVDNPAWYGEGDFFSWLETEVDVESNPPGGVVREFRVGLSTCKSGEDHYYIVTRIFDPFTGRIIRSKNSTVEMAIERQWASTNTSSRITAGLKPKASDVTRFETTATVLSASTTGDQADAQAWITMYYQPQEIADLPGSTDEHLFEVSVRLNYDKDGLELRGWVWGSQNDDGSIEYDIPSPTGDFPFDQTLSLNQTYTIAVECNPTTREFIVEFEGQRSSYDMSVVPEFDPADFRNATIRTRVRDIYSAGDSGAITVQFDDVKINSALYDDFNEGMAPNKWTTYSYE